MPTVKAERARKPRSNDAQQAGAKRQSAPADRAERPEPQKKQRKEKKGAPAGFQASPDSLEDIRRKVKQYNELQSGATKLSADDKAECVSDVMRFMLASNQKAPLVPVPYTKLQKELKKLQSKQTGIARTVIIEAQRAFLKLGWEMAELKSGVQAQYVLRTILPKEFMIKYICSDEEVAFTGLKLLIVLYLHTKADKASKADLHKFVCKFGVRLPGMNDGVKQEGEQRSAQEVFGCDDPIAKLLEQKYLLLTKDQAAGSGEGYEDVYKLGPAAEGEAAEMAPDEVGDTIQDLKQEVPE